MKIDYSVLSVEAARIEFQNLIDNGLSETTRAEFMSKMVPFMGEFGYFEYPASVKYHLNEPGGLLRHSVKTTMNALELNVLWFGYDPEKVVLAGLLHDFGKLGNICLKTRTQWPRYVREPRWADVAKDPSIFELECNQDVGFSRARFIGKNEWFYPYTYGTNLRLERDKIFMDMTDLDALLPAQVMVLSADVIQALKYADGLYVDTNKPYQQKVHPLAHLMHMADFYTGCIQEGGMLDLDTVWGLS